MFDQKNSLPNQILLCIKKQNNLLTMFFFFFIRSACVHMVEFYF